MLTSLLLNVLRHIDQCSGLRSVAHAPRTSLSMAVLT